MIGWLFWLLGLVAVADGARRTEALWVAADRNKTFWLILMTVTGAIGAVIYALAILPRLRSADLDPEFCDPNPWAHLTGRLNA